MTEQPLRILHTEASLGWGGQEIRILTEAQVFIKHGHTVHLLANEESEILKAAPRYGVPASPAPLRRKSLAGIRALRSFLRTWRPDVVNPHSSVDSWIVALARVGLRPRPRVVRTRHISAPIPRNVASRWLYNYGCDFIMTTGEAIVDQMTADGFVARDRIASVPTGIDTDRFRPGDKREARRAVGLPQDAFIFGIVATLRSWKGHADLLEAFAQLSGSGLHLAIVGDGPQEANIRSAIDRLGIADRVTLAGRQSDVVPWLQAFDTFVLPSYANEGIPQAILQAMAVGLPIISCPIGGIPEATRAVSGVVLIPPRNVAALGDAMLESSRRPAANLQDRGDLADKISLQSMYEAVSKKYQT
ncbi:glycosyltransferase family 4 protein [Chthonobacter albigriseus]|uniref:glycosyltransferase family 4 protein n=1 Tax=Chthonobacter albigriseus TaxID=1683161 RepID=UPI0015EFA82E|nr:glycosyltransferase family 4 protein [Chthonobacter albigriseus]